MSDAAGQRPFWYLRAGDAIRALACLGIVTIHASIGALYVTGNLAGAGGTLTWSTAWGEGGQMVLRTAASGFYVFFVLSGFLVAAPFVCAFIEQRPLPRIWPYFRNRALRLLPAAWLLFAFVLIRHGTRDASWWELVSMFGFADDHVDHPLSSLVGQTWTLRVDLAFYVLVPIAAVVAMRALAPRLGVTGRRRAVWAGAAGVTAVSLLLASIVPDTFGARRSPPILLCLFMPGVAVAAALAGRTSRPAPRHVGAIAVGLSVLGIAILAGVRRDGMPLAVSLMILGGGAVMALGGVILLETAAGRSWRWTTSRPVRWVGKRTYGIYLWHLVLMSELYPLVRGSESPGRTYLVLLPMVVLSACAAAAVSYRFVERPAMRLRHRMDKRPAMAEEPAGPAVSGATAPA